MHTGTPYMNGQPQRGFVPPPSQGYPAAGLPPGNLGQHRPGMPVQNPPVGQWPPGIMFASFISYIVTFKLLSF